MSNSKGYALTTGTGTAGQFLQSNGDGSSSWVAAPGTIARVYTVGIDNPTIQGCINLCTLPSSTNAYVIQIPPGSYTENLTLAGSVQLQGMTNPGDTTTVQITGTHTLNGAAVNPLDNRVTIANIIFANNTNAVTPTFAFTASTATQVNFFGCFLQNTNAATTSSILNIGSLVNCYLTSVVSRMSSIAGSGGTHFTVTGALYSGSGVDVDGGTRCVDVLTGGYAQMNGGQFYCSSGVGGEALRVAAGAIIAAGYCAIKNSASAANNAHGVNLLGLNAVMYATWVTFDVLNGASGYVVTGPAGSVYVSTACQYSNIPGLLTRNVKIKNTVTAASFTTTLTSSP